MYKELNSFLKHILTKKSIWTDGEIWTAVLLGGFSWVMFKREQWIIPQIREHFSELLTVSSIIFGFISTTLVFYIQTATNWSKDPKVHKVAQKLIDWHIWTIICILFLIGYILLIWSVGPLISTIFIGAEIQYSFLTFLIFYIGFQILNHILTVWWTFKNIERLK